MSFVDRNSRNTGSKALTGSAIALLQAAIAIALIKGFTVAFVDPAPPRNLPSQLFPTKPVPPPTETPEIVPEQKAPQRSVIDTPAPREKLPEIPTTPEIIPSSAPSFGSAENGAGLIDIPSIKPSEPAALFTPKTARPRGNMAGWVTTNDYPTQDIRAGHTGSVRFQLSIDANGGVTNCTVTRSSGYPGLDAATCRNVTRRARFEPATDKTGSRVASTFSGTIQWVIPRD